MDLSASVTADMLRMCNGDKAKFQEMAAGLKGQMQEEERRMQDRKIDELVANFPSLARDVIAQVLSENEWDVEKAIVPCFEVMEKERAAHLKKEQEEQKQKREAEKARLRLEARKNLEEIFGGVSKEKIQNMLDENEGDADLTAQQLVLLVEEERQAAEKAAETKKRQKEEAERQAALKRQVLVDVLKQKFGDYCSDDEIEHVLTKFNQDIKAAQNELFRLVESRKVEQLKRVHQDVSEVDLRSALATHDWDLISAMRHLRDVIAKKKLEEEKEQARREEEEEARLAKASEAEEAMKKEREAAAAKARAEAAAAEKKQQETDKKFLEHSIIIGKELEVLIQAQQEIAEREADPRRIIKEELENKLKFGPDNLPGLPGVAPLTRKVIDQQQGRESPVPDVPVEPAVAQPEKEDTSPAPGMEFTEVDNSTVTESGIRLRVLPESLDIRQTITVEWEADNAPSGSDWVGLYKKGSGNSSYITYNWIPSADKKGSLTFQPTEFGEFEARYFTSTSSFFSRHSTIKAVSNAVQVRPHIVLIPQHDAATNTLSVKVEQKSGNQYPSAWIALYGKGEKDSSQYRAFDWLSNAVDHTLKFPCPKAGEWEFRFFPQRSYVDVARTTISVGGTDRVELSLVDGQMIVKTELSTVDPALDSVWIGIYKTEENDNRQYRKYKYIGQASGQITFKSCTTPSTYEARVFAHKSLDVVCRSNTIVVPPKTQQ